MNTKEQGLPDELRLACARIVRDCLDRDQSDDDNRPLELWIADSVLGYAALRAQPAGGGVELKLRRLLAMRVAGAMLYTDDGELSDGTEHPAIDFLRHSPEEIESLLRRRAELKAAIATLTPPESGGQGDGYAALHGFARELLSMLNDGGPDGGDVQRVAESHGLLTSTPTIVPCGEDCPCAEFYNHGDESDCYRRAPWLTADLSQGGGNHG